MRTFLRRLTLLGKGPSQPASIRDFYGDIKDAFEHLHGHLKATETTEPWISETCLLNRIDRMPHRHSCRPKTEKLEANKCDPRSRDQQAQRGSFGDPFFQSGRWGLSPVGLQSGAEAVLQNLRNREDRD